MWHPSKGKEVGTLEKSAGYLTSNTKKSSKINIEWQYRRIFVGEVFWIGRGGKSGDHQDTTNTTLFVRRLLRPQNTTPFSRGAYTWIISGILSD